MLVRIIRSINNDDSNSNGNNNNNNDNNSAGLARADSYFSKGWKYPGLIHALALNRVRQDG